METTASRKGIPYKSNENRQSTHILVRLTESQKETIKKNATKNNQTISEYFRTLAIKHTSKK
jgi:uncharacterized protein (DUF1778 family)